MSGATGNRVIVVGGGVIGTACAHFLRQAGAEVTLLDKGAVGQGCSHGNCGFICTSHVLPLAGPGILGKTLWTLLQRNSPLKIRLRFDPSLWSWLFCFARHCNARDMLQAGRAIQALLNSSRLLYSELMHSHLLDAEWEERGLLLVFRTPAEMEHYAKTDRLLRESFNLPATRYDGEALTALEPALKPGLAGAWYYEGDAHLRPDRLMQSWRSLLVEQGVIVQEQCEFLGFERNSRCVRGVRTTQGTLATDAVVIAAGAWTPLLNKHLGCRTPIQPGKGYSITMPRPARCPRIPLLFDEDRVAVTPMQSGYRLGSTMEFAGYDTSLNEKRLHLLREGARRYLHEPEAEPITERWWGWRPMVPDGKPIIGRPPALDNVIVAAGHGMLGVSMAPATGKLVAELLCGATPHLDPRPYRVARWGGSRTAND
jgi:D-amino-acid dehydrogenase